MLRKNPKSEFASGAYVFPGGAVEPDDERVAARDDLIAGPSDSSASKALGIDEGGAAYFAAAIREAFEEAGVLLAIDASDNPRPIDVAGDRGLAERLAKARDELNAGEADFVAILAREEAVQLAFDELVYMSHWVTPVGPPRRYDTRFFMARAPDGQVALHEGSETVDTIWITPQEAIDSAGRGEIEIMFPTLKHLEMVAPFESVEAALRWARGRDVPSINPRVVSDGGGIRVLLPGDDGYEEAGP